MTQNRCVQQRGARKFGVLQAGAVIALLLLGRAAARAQQPALVQQATATYHLSSTVTVTLASAPRFGDALVLFSANDSVVIQSAAGGGVDWAHQVSSGSHSVCAIWWGFNSSSSGSSVTVTYVDGTGSGGVNVSEFSGLAPIAPDNINSSQGVSATPFVSVGTRTPNDLILAAAADQSVNPTTGGPTNSFTALTEAADTNKIIPAYRIASVAGSYNTSWTEGIGGWDAVVVALQASTSYGVSLSSLSLSPSSVTAGTALTGTVTLSGLAQGGDASVTLVSSNTSAAQVPPTVTVPSGSTSNSGNDRCGL